MDKKLGIMISSDYIPYKQILDMLPMLEGSFTHVFVPELWGRDALSQVAAMVSAIECEFTYGTAIVNIFSRSPATLAQSAATLSEMTNGKFILGLGLSGPIVIQDWHGYSFYGKSPMQRTREYLEIIRLILSGERCNYDGEIFKLRNFKLLFQPDHIPLFLAALGPKNVQIAGELADGWFPIWLPFDNIDLLLKDIDAGKEKAEKTRTVDIAPVLITCASNSPKAKLLVQNHLAYYVGGMGTFYNNLMKRLGFVDEAEKIKTAWMKGDRELAAKNVSNSMIDAIAIMGSAEDVVDKYSKLEKMGVTIPIVMLPFKCPPDLAMETVGCFSQ
ncbi:MAG: LLM class flavin-dependent oxidoreductase [Candidatus Hodarchaeales archaeon]|jgi:alkanesulfonate monooxygenase SsuD/methylene tetrahydromethanopterin reductase-like flavin-dependent oxidoreductase (luciferase family)